jgi:hypothetical protein
LLETVRAVLARGGERLVVWTPSTVMLDGSGAGIAYCVAKAAMEELCRQLPSILPVVVHAPRLGRIDTDQTMGLIRVPAAPALATVIEQLRSLGAAPATL